MSAADLLCIQQIEMRRLTCAVRSGGATCHLELKELTAMRLVGSWVSTEAQWLFLFPRRNAESAGNANEWSPLSWKELPEVSWHSGLDNVEFSYFSHPMFEFLSLPFFFYFNYFIYMNSNPLSLPAPFVLSVRGMRSVFSLPQGKDWMGGWFSEQKILGMQRIQLVRKAAHQVSGLSLWAVGYPGQLAFSTQVARDNRMLPWHRVGFPLPASMLLLT